jgi:hypothetical protein
MKATEIHKRATDRAIKAAELRSNGLTYRQIGEQLERHQGEGPLSVEAARSLAKKGERIIQHRASQRRRVE